MAIIMTEELVHDALLCVIDYSCSCAKCSQHHSDHIYPFNVQWCQIVTVKCSMPSRYNLDF